MTSCKSQISESRILQSEEKLVPIMNAIYAVCQLVGVAFCLGQITALNSINSALESDATKNGEPYTRIVFNGPFFKSEATNISGLASTYIIFGSVLHLASSILLIAGSKRESALSCQIWLGSTILFFLTYLVMHIVKILASFFGAPNMSELLTNGSQICVRVTFGALIMLEGFQIWVLYQLAREEQGFKFEHNEILLDKSDSSHKNQAKASYQKTAEV